MDTQGKGFTLPELLLVTVVLGLLARLALGSGAETMARLRVESASRRVMVGLERARVMAERRGQACAMALGSTGWQAPQGSSLPACHGVAISLGEGVERGEVQLDHNLPASVRFSSNGLVLDGGTVLVAAEGTELVRCVVVSLPLGITRVGRHGPAGCLPDRAL